MKRRSYLTDAKNVCCGIPDVLESIRYEKPDQVVPVKLQISLVLWLKQVAGSQGVSGWVRETIIERLERELEEAESE